jgi:hypothetical protein
MTTITNQTLTLTITSGSVVDVIRKDNCRVDVIGDYVRLTDFFGNRFEFLYTEVDEPASASATELAEAIEVFLNSAGSGGGGGVETVTGFLVDNDDPANPVVSIPQGTFTPTVSNIQAADDVTVTACWYVDYGTVVSYRIGFDMQLSTGEVNGIFEIDVPVPSNFANGRQANAVSNNGVNAECLSVTASSSAPNTIAISVIGNASGATIASISIDIEYLKV